MSALLQLENLTKSYPGVIANDAVSLSVASGEIHAILGENGAGKSTLVKMIYGLVRPDAGRMVWQDEPYTPRTPSEARRSGIAMVFQHFSLFEAMTVAENIALGMEDPPAPRVLTRRIAEVSEHYRMPIDPDRTIADLSAGERQRIEIIRCLLQNPWLLIMDEPTSVLTPQEVDTLFETLRALKAEGRSILYISHKLSEIQALCDHATILRHGKVIATCTPAEETPATLAALMIGDDLAAPAPRKARPGRPILEARDITLPAPDPLGTDLDSISFDVREGEILGIGGIAGNGQDELLAALSGERLPEEGILWLEGRDVIALPINERRRAGLLAAPEERLGHAAAPTMALWENIFLSARVRERLDIAGFIKADATRNFARAVIEAYDVRTTGPDQPAAALSGGNLQKFVMGREIMQTPRVLVACQPTWGVDAAAAAAIRAALRDLADKGAGVVVISQDLDELMEISDSIAILSNGRLSQPAPAGSLSVEAIGLLMEGQMEAPHVSA